MCGKGQLITPNQSGAVLFMNEMARHQLLEETLLGLLLRWRLLESGKMLDKESWKDRTEALVVGGCKDCL